MKVIYLLLMLVIVTACGSEESGSTDETTSYTTAPETSTTVTTTTVVPSESVEQSTTTTEEPVQTPDDGEWGQGDVIEEPEVQDPGIPLETPGDLATFPAPAENPGVYYTDGSVNYPYIEYIADKLGNIGDYCSQSGDGSSGVAQMRWYGLAQEAYRLQGEYLALLSS